MPKQTCTCRGKPASTHNMCASLHDALARDLCTKTPKTHALRYCSVSFELRLRNHIFAKFRSMLCRDANQEVNQPNSVQFPYTTGRTESNLTAESVKKAQSFAAGPSGRCSCLERKPADLTAWVYSVKKSTRKKAQAKILRQDVQQNIRYAWMVYNHTTTQINIYLARTWMFRNLEIMDA